MVNDTGRKYKVASELEMEAVFKVRIEDVEQEKHMGL